MAAPDSKSFMSMGLFSTMFAGGLILSVDETKFNPNGILVGEWGHYTDESDPSSWVQLPEILMVALNNTIVSNGAFKIGLTETNISSLCQNLTNPGPVMFYDKNNVHSDVELLYQTGLKHKDTKNLYRWYLK